MLKRLSERLGERKMVLLCACGVVAAMVLAALLPLAFRTPAPEPQPETGISALERRSALFVDFWTNGEEAEAKAEAMIPDRAMETFCEDEMRTIVSRSVDDREFSYTVPTGREYTTVSDGSGEVRLCRMWLQARGDWQNWVDTCFDAESGQIYYLYVSRECLTNRDRYADAREGRDSAEAVAKLFAAETGLTLRRFSGDAHSGLAVLEREDGLICYEIRCNWYDALIDIQITCV